MLKTAKLKGYAYPHFFSYLSQNMTLRQYLILMGVGTAIAWGCFWLVLNYLNPETAGAVGFTLFYLSLFLGLTGTITLLGFTWRYFQHRDEVLFRHVTASFRQATFLALTVVVGLFLQSQGQLSWWNLILLVVGVTCLELFLLSVRRSPPQL